MRAKIPKACVIGRPVGHSRSPLIHNYWFAQLGLPGAYEALEVKPDSLRDFFSRLRDGAYVGCNVTVPHKQAVLDFVDGATPEVERLQAANTIYRRGDRLMAANTDGSGFLAHLAQTVPEFEIAGATIMLLGAGGAARGITAALLDKKPDRLMIANRTRARAEKIAVDFAGPVCPLAWDDAARNLAACNLLVNTTAAGMTGQPALDIPLAALPAHGIVADIVYSPLRTGLLMRAEKAGHRCVDGLGMLLHQAAPAFELWFGVRPEVRADLRRVVEQDMERAP